MTEPLYFIPEKGSFEEQIFDFYGDFVLDPETAIYENVSVRGQRFATAIISFVSMTLELYVNPIDRHDPNPSFKPDQVLKLTQPTPIL